MKVNLDILLLGIAGLSGRGSSAWVWPIAKLVAARDSEVEAHIHDVRSSAATWPQVMQLLR